MVNLLNNYHNIQKPWSIKGSRCLFLRRWTFQIHLAMFFFAQDIGYNHVCWVYDPYPEFSWLPSCRLTHIRNSIMHLLIIAGNNHRYLSFVLKPEFIYPIKSNDTPVNSMKSYFESYWILLNHHCFSPCWLEKTSPLSSPRQGHQWWRP